MKRLLPLTLTLLALASGAADAQRRSGGGFGGSRGGFSAPRAPRYVPPRNTAPRVPVTPSTSRTPSAAQTSGVGSAVSAANRAAAARVTPSQLSAWRSVRLPAGVPRSALTYSAGRSAGYPHQLSPGRYYPQPASYYRSRGIGSDLLRAALIYTAVSGVAGALNGPDGDGVADSPAAMPVTAGAQGPNLWTYAGVGFFAAAAGWFLLGRRRR